MSQPIINFEIFMNNNNQVRGHYKSFMTGLNSLLLLVGLCISHSVSAQPAIKSKFSNVSKIYKLDQEQFQNLVKYQSIHDSLKLFTHFVMDVPTNRGFYVDSVPYGHYLGIIASGSQINYKLYSKSFFKVQSHGYNKEVWHIITDQEGKVITEATLSHQNKVYSYQKDCNCYPVPAKRGNDTILITYLNHFELYQSKANYNEQGEYEVQNNQYPKQRLSDIRILPGYVAFNQPMYRKKDTVKVKAFLVNEKGKIWRKRKVIVKYTTPEGKTIVLGKIKRQSEGAYQTEFVVPEKYRLGNYNLTFWTSWDEVKLRSEIFKINDYELQPAYKFSSVVTQPTFYRGQDVEFRLKAQDINELPLLDAKAKIKIQAIQQHDFYDKLFYWTGKADHYTFEKEVLFDVAGETIVNFPDSLFPNTKMTYTASIEYNNDLGKLYSNTINFTFDAKPSHFEFRLKGDSIAADYFKFDKTVVSKQLTLLSMRGYDTIESKVIEAPYREKIDLFNTLYVLKHRSGLEIGRVSLNHHNKIPVSLAGKRTHDSIQIQLVNDLQMPVSYQIFKRDKKIAGGQWKKGDNPFIYQSFDESVDDYHVFYSILWRNKHFIKEQIFYLDETKLNININQPDIVFPGSKVPVEVTVTDYKNRGVEGANITAYSVNDLFPESPTPNLPYFGRLHSGFINKFNVRNSTFTVNRGTMLTPKHLDQFELRKTPFYHFAYATNGVGIHQDSIGGEYSELAVYTSKFSSIKPIYAVYINNEPAAIDGSSNSGFYNFLKPAGKYEVKIRTKTHQYTIKNIELIAGEKTYLCLNEYFIEGNKNVEYLQIEDAPFTKVEWNFLKPNFMYLTRSNNNYIFEQDGMLVDMHQVSNYSMFYDNGHWYNFIGPFKEGKVNVYNQKKDTITSFDYYPGYLYRIDKTGTVVIDRPAPSELSSEKFRLNSQVSDWNFNYKIQRWEDYLTKAQTDQKKQDQNTAIKKPLPEINYDNPARFQQLKSFSPQEYDKTNYGAIKLKNNTGKKMYWVLCHHKTNPKANGALYTANYNYNGLTAGLYDIMVLYSDSSYSLIQNFNVRSNGTNFYRLDSNEVKPADLEVQTYYEEIIVNANKAPLNRFTNKPLYFDNINLKTTETDQGQTVLSGFIVNTYHQPLNNVNLIFEMEGRFKYGALTNIDGYFELPNVVAGIYTIKMGSQLPYQVYEDLTVRQGMKTRIVIGKDPALRINSAGDLEVDVDFSHIENSPTQAYYGTAETVVNGSPNYSYSNNISASKLTTKDIQMIPAMRNSSDLQAVMISTDGVTYYEPPNTFETAEYPNLKVDEQGNRIKEYAKKKGLDKATMDMIRQSDSLNRIRDHFRDYGYWVPNMVTDVNGNARFTVQFPDNITRWKTIVPAMTGDKQTGLGIRYAQSFKPLSAHLGIPSFLIEGDSIMLEGKVLNYTSDSISANTWFKLNNDTLKSGIKTTNRTIAERYWFSYPSPDSIQLGYGLKMADGYLDGEERDLSVLTEYINQVKGELYLMDDDSLLTISADSNKRSVYIYNKPLGIYEREINKLKNYRYGCNEQTASKLKALLLEEKIANALEQPFKGANTIRTCIRILEKNQMPDGSYGWWGRASYKQWVSAYVLEALSLASKSYKVDKYMLTARLLRTKMPQMTISGRLSSLNTLANINYPMDYKSHIERLDTLNLSLKDSFKLIHLKQQQNRSVSVDKVLQSVVKKPEGVFWGESLFNGHINIWETSALAYKILRNVGGHEKLMSEMRDYFLQLNPEGRNTIERATLLELFLEDELLANETASAFKGDVWINDVKIESFPYFKTFEPNESIHIRKSGKRVCVQVNTHLMLKNPVGNDSLVTVSTSFKQRNLQTDSLVAGKPVQMTVTVNVKEKMDYVLLEIPIPASCIYNSQKSKGNPYESYREDFRHMTAISCASLPRGKHLFKINLIPRYEGRFKVVPVKVEEMYFPVNANYSKAKIITVH